MPLLEYNSPVIPIWNVNIAGVKISVKIQNEQHVIANNRTLLVQLPDEYYGVTISGMNYIDINRKIL